MTKSKPAAALIFKSLTDLPSLEILDWGGRLEASQIRAMGERLECLPRLTVLRFFNTVYLDCLEALAAVVMELPSLEQFILKDHPFLLHSQRCIGLKSALVACGFREEEDVPGQKDAQHEAEDVRLGRMARLGMMRAFHAIRTLDLRRALPRLPQDDV